MAAVPVAKSECACTCACVKPHLAWYALVDTKAYIYFYYTTAQDLIQLPSSSYSLFGRKANDLSYDDLLTIAWKSGVPNPHLLEPEDWEYLNITKAECWLRYAREWREKAPERFQVRNAIFLHLQKQGYVVREK